MDPAADSLPSRLFHNQISSADLIVLSKVDLFDDAQRAAAHEWLATLYPDKRVIEAVNGDVPVELLLGLDSKRDLKAEASEPSDHASTMASVIINGIVAVKDSLVLRVDPGSVTR